MEPEGRAVKITQADQEYKRPSPASQTGRLGVQKKKFPYRRIRQFWLARNFCDERRRVRQQVRQGTLSVDVIHRVFYLSQICGAVRRLDILTRGKLTWMRPGFF